MKRVAWSAALAIVIVGGLAATDSACTLVVNGDDGGNPTTGTDSSTQETSTAAETGTPADTGTRQDTGAPMDGGEGGTCAVQADTGSAVCDQCLDAMCCTESVTCATPDASGVDDAGASACAQLAQCVVSWVAADAGTQSDGEAVCGPSYTAAQRNAAHALLACIHDKCFCL